MNAQSSANQGASVEPSGMPTIPVTIVTVLVMALAAGLAFVAWRRDAQVTAEHHLLEWTETAVLLLGCAVHGMRAWWDRRLLDTILRAGLALLCLSFALRETDIDRLGDSTLWPIVEWGARGVVAMLWIGLAVFIVPRFERLWPMWRRAIAMPYMVYAIAGCVLYLLSLPLDKHLIPVSTAVSVFAEEAVQLNATILLCAAGVVGSGRSRRFVLPVQTRD